MPWWAIVLIVVGSLLVLGLLVSVVLTFIVAYIVYSKTLMRGKSGTWGREHCSEPGCEALETMWVRGIEWPTKAYITYFLSKSSKIACSLTQFGETGSSPA